MGFTIDFETLPGYPRDAGSWPQLRAVTKVKCAWDDRYTLGDEFSTIPNNVYPYNSSGITVQSVQIEPYRDASGNSSQMGNYAGDDRYASYDEAVLTVNYSSLAPSTANLITEKSVPANMTVPQSAKNKFWPNGDEVDDRQMPPIVLPGHMVVLTYHQAAAKPAAFYSAEGSVNPAQFTTPVDGDVYAAGSLLYMAPRSQHVLTMAGLTKFTLEYRLWYCSWGWNNVWNINAGAAQQIEDENGVALKLHREAAWPI